MSARAPLIVAHRGAWGVAPQNSLKAFATAIDLGCDGIELDVRRTADGRLVVLHDARVGARAVARLEHGQLRALLAPDEAPELDAALAQIAGRVIVDVEIKEDGYVAETMEVVTRHLPAGRFVVTSFRDAVLPQVKAFVPEARTGLLLASRGRATELERRLRASGADFVGPHATLARAGLLEWAARRGLPAWVWTVNDPRPLRALCADERVEAVITDRPERALEVRGTNSSLNIFVQRAPKA